MSIKLILRIIFFLTISLISMVVLAGQSERKIDEKNVINTVKQAKAYIQQYGKNKAISKFKKNSSLIFAIEFSGTVLASPIHPETVGTNQINFKDSSGALVVKQEIDKAIAGGGWLKGRYRKNHKTGQNECRRLYILPMKGNYLIGSWYYYAMTKKGKCLI
ncbi:cache domain-containing protein [Legionella taurinensis]|uniref:cache domain-containing protein n=1 Tax=Legionella taurinensis TaxID=70611 RepID=UPI000E03D158|nr:cache domain-containing protein [Legionella taurinensis]STY25144.1 Signal transduction histidine kinase [Legionella taurinensis]